jgi:hypothetical protein
LLRRWSWLWSGVCTARHFAIDADVNKLISGICPGASVRRLSTVLRRKKKPFWWSLTPDLRAAAQATDALIQRLADKKDLFRSIFEAGGGPFFQKNGLLFLPIPEVIGTTKKLGEAKPIIQSLAQDPNLRGLTTALNYGLIGARMNHYTLDDLSGTLNMVSGTLEDVIASRPAGFSWRAMLNGRPPNASERRRFIEIRPVLDYSSLTPGQAATDAIRTAAADLKFSSQYRASLRLTGPWCADEEYATLNEGAVVNTTATIVIADHPVAGLAVVADHRGGLHQPDRRPVHHRCDRPGAGGALNLISVVAVLFIGLGVDFGIQFSVRYRAERHEIDDLHPALLNTAICRRR